MVAVDNEGIHDPFTPITHHHLGLFRGLIHTQCIERGGKRCGRTRQSSQPEGVVGGSPPYE